MSTVNLSQDQYLECENLTEGVFYPVTKFMDQRQFECVVNNMQLITGEVYTIPIVFDVSKQTAREMLRHERVKLEFMNEFVGYLYPDSFFEPNRTASAEKIFGTCDSSHPGVCSFMNLEQVFVSGSVDLIRPIETSLRRSSLTPEKTRDLFKEKGWNRVTGFQTRNIPHRAHEYLLRLALESSDGLFIQPLLGKKKSGDFTAEAILSCYQELVTEFLPTDRVVLGSLSTKMRYAGPREAIFHALIRKNYGCTDFIIGRDQAGVGHWYGKYEAQQLAKILESSLGIRILALEGPYHCSKCDAIVTENTCSSKHHAFRHEISGSYIRKVLSSGEVPDSRFIRPEIVKALEGISIFVE